MEFNQTSQKQPHSPFLGLIKKRLIQKKDLMMNPKSWTAD